MLYLLPGDPFGFCSLLLLFLREDLQILPEEQETYECPSVICIQILLFFILFFFIFTNEELAPTYPKSSIFLPGFSSRLAEKPVEKSDNNHSTRYIIYCTEAIFIISAVPLMLSFLLGLLSLLCLSGLKHNS